VIKNAVRLLLLLLQVTELTVSSREYGVTAMSGQSATCSRTWDRSMSNRATIASRYHKKQHSISSSRGRIRSTQLLALEHQWH
jgi:hypothetical protein